MTGLSALLLAHYPAFQGPLRFRSPQRVAALHSMIRGLCVPYGFGAERTGAGLPRLHGIEQVLQPSPQKAEQRAGSYVQPALVAQAWPVQALLESLRRQYLGN